MAMATKGAMLFCTRTLRSTSLSSSSSASMACCPKPHPPCGSPEMTATKARPPRRNRSRGLRRRLLFDTPDEAQIVIPQTPLPENPLGPCARPRSGRRIAAETAKPNASSSSSHSRTCERDSFGGNVLPLPLSALFGQLQKRKRKASEGRKLSDNGSCCQSFEGDQDGESVIGSVLPTALFGRLQKRKKEAAKEKKLSDNGSHSQSCDRDRDGDGGSVGGNMLPTSLFGHLQKRTKLAERKKLTDSGSHRQTCEGDRDGSFNGGKTSPSALFKAAERKKLSDNGSHSQICEGDRDGVYGSVNMLPSAVFKEAEGKKLSDNGIHSQTRKRDRDADSIGGNTPPASLLGNFRQRKKVAMKGKKPPLSGSGLPHSTIVKSLAMQCNADSFSSLEKAPLDIPPLASSAPHRTHLRPYPQECLEVRNRLQSLHGPLEEFSKHRIARLNRSNHPTLPALPMPVKSEAEVEPEAQILSTQRSGEVGLLSEHFKERRTVLDALVGTILSQNTTEKNSRTAFASLKQAFPTWEEVLKANPKDVENAIRCGGLAEIKATRICTILETLHKERGKVCLEHLRSMSIEEIKSELSRFKGVGPKTIACVLMFHLQQDEFPVDTHVFRISKMLGWVPANSDREKAYTHLNSCIPNELKFDLHCLLVTHGRRCPHCAKGGRTQRAADGPCPLVNWTNTFPQILANNLVKSSPQCLLT